MKWKRVIFWSLAIVASGACIGGVAGIFFWHSESSGRTVDLFTIDLFKVAFAITATACYWRLGAGAAMHRGAHIVAALLLVETCFTVLGFLAGQPVETLFDPTELRYSVACAFAGYVLAHLMPNAAPRATPVGDDI